MLDNEFPQEILLASRLVVQQLVGSSVTSWRLWLLHAERLLRGF